MVAHKPLAAPAIVKPKCQWDLAAELKALTTKKHDLDQSLATLEARVYALEGSYFQELAGEQDQPDTNQGIGCVMLGYKRLFQAVEAASVEPEEVKPSDDNDTQDNEEQKPIEKPAINFEPLVWAENDRVFSNSSLTCQQSLDAAGLMSASSQHLSLPSGVPSKTESRNTSPAYFGKERVFSVPSVIPDSSNKKKNKRRASVTGIKRRKKQ